MVVCSSAQHASGLSEIKNPNCASGCQDSELPARVEPRAGALAQHWLCPCSGFVRAVPAGGSGCEHPPGPPALHVPGPDPVHRVVI